VGGGREEGGGRICRLIMPSTEKVRFFMPTQADMVRFEAVYKSMKQQVLVHLPNADIYHVGSSAVPGLLTKGDVDINVRCTPDDFFAYEAVLVQLFNRNNGSDRTEDFSAFETQADGIDVGIQLSTYGFKYARFVEFRDALRLDPARVVAYNDLKKRHQGADMDAYRVAKGSFINEVLAAISLSH